MPSIKFIAFLLAAHALAASAAEPPLIEAGTLKITVLDEKGASVAGATVDPDNVFSAAGATLWTDPQTGKNAFPHRSFRTDERGNVDLPYPKFMHGTDRNHLIDSVSLFASKPGFAHSHETVAIHDGAYTLALAHGTTVTVRARLPEGTPPGDLYAELDTNDTSTAQMRWTRAADQTSVISTFAFPPGDHIVRAVWRAPDGALWFSALTPFTSEADVPALDLALEVSRGRDVQAVLDSSVPRPVGHGVVIAYVQAHPDGRDDRLPVTEPNWRTHADVASDGTFTLKNVPAGQICLTAIVEGHVSAQPPTHSVVSHPLTFASDAAQPLVVEMEKTGAARLRVLSRSGQPLAAARVSVWPNEHLDYGTTTILGNTSDTLDWLRWSHDERTPDPVTPKAWPSYDVETGADGLAMLRDLPCGDFEVAVRRLETKARSAIKVVAGEETTAEVTLDIP